MHADYLLTLHQARPCPLQLAEYSDRQRPLYAAAMPLFEACVDCLESAVAAQAAGAARVELCDALIEGGTTPSLGKIRAVAKALSIPVHVLIRPRAGDFLYTPSDLAIMVDDIEAAKAAGAAGAVVGALTPEGHVDEGVTRTLVAAARPMAVTFHRAVDVARDYAAAMSAAARCGCDYVLTSGGAATAEAGAAAIRAAGAGVGVVPHPGGGEGGMTIIAGGGVTAGNVRRVVEGAGVSQVHGSARVTVPSGMTWAPPPAEVVYMGGERRNSPEAEAAHRRATVESIGGILLAMQRSA